MGAGGRMTEKERELFGRGGAGATFQRSPTDKPPFTLAQIKKAIPPHCFQRSVIKSFSYLVHDLVIVGALLYVALVWIPTLPSVLQLGAWPLYWVLQGCVMTGVWVIAHECGHNAFSDSSLLDDIVGLVLHSWLLVPYFSRKYSHRRHHLFSNMPHYHAMEATKAIKPILGEYYQFDPTPVAKATWREAKECIYVEPEDRTGVFWYSNKFAAP
ncbi:unnamed protein product [Triticum turgidum subsp. durum]|uniref:Fatty acid desaturase N-terminal domain-containing protein n=1 Tax=Triticum turgidum subsp. durum TaxID=4567 RepID=A0A9R1BD30_TRITD|nr:unnamed protein product [Triticum turgidum subsp. durum]